MARFGAYAAMPTAVMARRWSTPEGRALFAGVAAHALRPFTSPMSSAIGIALGTAAHTYGWPVAEGGSSAITGAMISLLKEHGATLETGVEVHDLAELGAPDVTILDLDPWNAARIAGDRIPPRVAKALRRYRRGPGTFKVEFAVQDGIPWTYEPTRRAGTVHVSGDLAETAAAERDVNRGRMPERPFVLLCQQYLADPTRSNGDVHPIYAYAHVPSGWRGDATAQIEAQIERFAPGFRDRILARNVRTVAQTEAYNANFQGGDTITGANDPLQMVFRPRAALDPYSMGTPGLFICSAATPPGAGAHGMCGFNAATSALKGLRR
jgi:phytoene dehydrogenase-like protein